MDTLITLMYEPLERLIIGGLQGSDRLSQVTATTCLDEFLEHLFKRKDNAFLIEIANRFIPVFLVAYLSGPLILFLEITIGVLSASKCNEYHSEGIQHSGTGRSIGASN